MEDDDDDDDDDDDNDDDEDERLHAIRQHGGCSICTVAYLNVYICVCVCVSMEADENSINTDYYRPCHVVYAHEYPRIFVLGQKLIELIPIYIYPRYFIYTSFFIFPRQEGMIHRLISIDMQGICIFQGISLRQVIIHSFVCVIFKGAENDRGRIFV